MFDIGLPEMLVLGVIALLVFGPERLPEVALQAARMIKKLRGMAESARSEFGSDIEPHLRELQELRELDPRKLAKNYVLDPADGDGTFSSLSKKGGSKKKVKKPAKPAVGPAVLGADSAGLPSSTAGLAGAGLAAGPVPDPAPPIGLPATLADELAAADAAGFGPMDEPALAGANGPGLNGSGGNGSGANGSEVNGSGATGSDGPVSGDTSASELDGISSNGPAVPLAMASSSGPAPFDPDAT